LELASKNGIGFLWDDIEGFGIRIALLVSVRVFGVKSLFLTTRADTSGKVSWTSVTFGLSSGFSEPTDLPILLPILNSVQMLSSFGPPVRIVVQATPGIASRLSSEAIRHTGKLTSNAGSRSISPPKVC